MKSSGIGARRRAMHPKRVDAHCGLSFTNIWRAKSFVCQIIQYVGLYDGWGQKSRLTYRKSGSEGAADDSGNTQRTRRCRKVHIDNIIEQRQLHRTSQTLLPEKRTSPSRERKRNLQISTSPTGQRRPPRSLVTNSLYSGNSSIRTRRS
jgi:hypothetical protein